MMSHLKVGRTLLTLFALLALLMAACAPEADEPEPAPDQEEPVEEPDEPPDPEEPAHSLQDGDVITLILPTSPGGGFEQQTRALEPYFEEAMREAAGVDVTLQIEAMPGAGHLVGLQHAVRSEPDGRTLIYMQADIGVGHQVVGGEDLDMTSFVPLGSLGVNVIALAVRTDLDLPERSLMGLAERSQQTPLLMATSGTERQIDLMIGLLSEEDVEMAADYVIVDGMAGVIASLLRNEVEVGVVAIPGVVPQIEDNPDELELLVSLGCDPSPAAPEMPTIVEEGVPSAEEICATSGEAWRFVAGPPGLSEADAAVLAQAMEMATSDPGFQEGLRDTGFEPAWMGPEELEAYVRDLVASWDRLQHFIQEED